jgi:nucleotide-binding universal stress UspA family protein
MKKLLLPVDGSASSLRAAAFAARLLAGQPSATVLLLNVQPPVMAWEVSPYVTAEMVHQIHERAGRDAAREARAALEAEGIACEEHMLVGEPGEIIAEVAAREGVDGIVMGTRGLGPIKSLVLGSVATKVIHLAEVPVTLVK